MAAKDINGTEFDHLVLVKTGGMYQKEIMDAAVSTEAAIALADEARRRLVTAGELPGPGAEDTARKPPEPVTDMAEQVRAFVVPAGVLAVATACTWYFLSRWRAKKARQGPPRREDGI
jgi:hypothetical protein